VVLFFNQLKAHCKALNEIKTMYKIYQNNFFKLTISVFIAEMAGVIGSIFTSSAINGWYANVIKPELSPPNWVFGPVWTTLFALMGIALFLVWKKGLNKKSVRVAIWIFAVQLVLNILWSLIFFGLRSPRGAFVEIIILWLGILATIVFFARVSKPAALLLAPYILWVSFASCLNFAIWTLN
jgi:tryptophan-rich sensory protein